MRVQSVYLLQWVKPNFEQNTNILTGEGIQGIVGNQQRKTRLKLKMDRNSNRKIKRTSRLLSLKIALRRKISKFTMRSFWLLLDNNSLLKVYHLVYKCKNILNCALENMICALCTSNCAPNKFGANCKLSSLGWAKQDPLKGKSEPSKHLQENNDHVFALSILHLHLHHCERRNLEASIIAIKRPSLSN